MPVRSHNDVHPHRRWIGLGALAVVIVVFAALWLARPDAADGVTDAIASWLDRSGPAWAHESSNPNEQSAQRDAREVRRTFR